MAGKDVLTPTPDYCTMTIEDLFQMGGEEITNDHYQGEIYGSPGYTDRRIRMPDGTVVDVGSVDYS